MSTAPVCPKGGRHLTAMHAAACPACQEQALVLLDSAEREFANFHRQLCERFGYAHDPEHWRRDQISLIEHIAVQLARADGTAGKAVDEILNVLEGTVPARDPFETRYRVQRKGLRWLVMVGTATRPLARFWRWKTAARMAQDLQTAFADGRFVGHQERV